MDDQKQQIAERLKQANNILVTVSSNPSVDQLAACIGLTIACNKMNKHATAVFSGAVPSTIEFLQPEKTLEKNTDSLRDFIIALDKSKADKLRYKVEDKVVKIFITPYRTSINEKDLQFSQGDFNVDVVVALGVHEQGDLDQAITAHGRILHDATIATINVKPGGELGTMNWLDPKASSLSELAVELLDTTGQKLMDNQIATAFLTGIVAETDRFSNEKTTPQTMSISAELMSAGANQQLVATKLEAPAPPAPAAPPISQQGPSENNDKPSEPPAEKPAEDGTLEIKHDDSSSAAPLLPVEPAPPEPQIPVTPQIHIDEHGSLHPLDNQQPLAPPIVPAQAPAPMLPPPPPPPASLMHTEGPKMMLQPPTFASELTANTAGAEAPSGGSLSLPQVEPVAPILDRQPLAPSVAPPIAPPQGNRQAPLPPPPPAPTFVPSSAGMPNMPTPPLSSAPSATPPSPPPPAPVIPPLPPPAPGPEQTLTDLERSVSSTHADGTDEPAGPPPPPTPLSPPPAPSSTPSSSPPSNDQNAPGMPDVDKARAAVDQAISSAPTAGEQSLEPIVALNAQPLGTPLHQTPPPADPNGTVINPTTGEPAYPTYGAVYKPQNQTVPPPPSAPDQFGGPVPPPPLPGSNADPSAPPPVPPPMVPPSPGF
ncbi:MAG TPA: hypothetical protein VMY99_00405 [Nevskiaceae bacterium]|nr:hypothetical protein [Nevskiaceae bacterium]